MTYGTVRYDESNRKWRIECLPHVALRLKRVFPKIDAREHGVFSLSDTVDNARDVEWFLARYPMELVDGGRLGERSKAHAARTDVIESLLSMRIPPPEFDLAIPPRDYQRVAAAVLLAQGGLLLADDVGVGKTISGIATLADARTLPALVVTLAHLPHQWEAEINRFAPQLNTHIIRQGRPYDLTESRRGQKMLANHLPDVLIINYHKLNAWAETLAPIIKGHGIVFDEIQELRRTESQKYSAARHLANSAGFRLGLSATPIYNYGGEIFSVLSILFPDGLGTYDEFRNEWCTAGGSDKPRIKDPIAFSSHIRETGMMLRRTRADVKRELPPITKIPHHIDCDPEALDRVSASCSELAKLILAQTESTRGQKMRASEELSNVMRQATGIAKAPYVAEFVRLLVESGERIVLYGWHRACYDIWRDRLRDLNPVMYTGSESDTQKRENKEKFMRGESQVMIISLRSGAGLDGLQKVCRTVVFGELDWSPGVLEQCLSEDTEVLTPEGFKGRLDIGVGDTVCGFDRHDSSMRWVSATAKADRPLAAGERMFSTSTEKIDLCVTEGHRMIVRRKRRTTRGIERSAWDIKTASELSGKARRFIPTCGNQYAPGVALTDFELRLIGWYLTDGGLNRRTNTLHIYQAATQPWNQDIIEVLNGCGLSWTVTQRVVGSGTLMNTYRVPKLDMQKWSQSEVDEALRLKRSGAARSEIAAAIERSPVAVYKKLRHVSRGERSTGTVGREGRGWGHLLPYLDKDICPMLENVTREQLASMIHGIEMGDGAKARVNTIRISNSNKVFLDRLQSLCVRRGFSASISKLKPPVWKEGDLVGPNAIRKPMYSMFISDIAEASIPRPDKPNGFAPTASPAGTRVWCLTNELGTLVTRRNGKVSIVGNCVGRVARDGQADPVMAYYLVSDSGSDPVVSEVLGLKRMQSDAIRDQKLELVEKLNVDPNHMKRLAESYLERAKVAA